MRYHVIAQRIEKRGAWRSSLGVPTFYIEASDPQTACTLARTVLGVDLPERKHLGTVGSATGDGAWDLTTGEAL